MEHITKVKDLYEQTVSMISQSEESWKDFLECMGRLYQLDFLNTAWYMYRGRMPRFWQGLNNGWSLTFRL